MIKPNSVTSLANQANKLSKTKKKLFNPTTKDFTVKFHQKPYTIHAQEIEEFDYPVAMHIRKHLGDLLMGEAEILMPDDKDWQMIYNRIDVEA